MDRITLEDGYTAMVGDKVYNYYDMREVTIVRIDTDGWADCRRDDGAGMDMLNGARMCSLTTATNKGWRK